MNGDLVYDDVFLWIGDASSNIVDKSEFYYSTDAINWTQICDDDDGSERTVSGRDVPLSSWGDGWSCYWDSSNMVKGWYYLRGKMLTSNDEWGQVDLQVYVDPNPPLPIIYNPSYDDVLQGEVEIDVACTHEDIVDIRFEILDASLYYEKGVEVKQQAHYCHNVSGENLSDVCCGPTAAASCLKYWSENGFPTIMEDPITGESITQSELVEKLAEWMDTDENGTKDSDFVQGLRDYLEIAGVGCTNPNGLIVRVEENGYGNPPMDEHSGNNLTYEKYRKELEENHEDVLWGVQWNWNATSKKWENGHWITGNSVNSTLLNDSDGDGLKEHEVDLMDPTENQIIKVKMNTDGTYVDPTIDEWMYPDIMVTVSEKNPLAESWLNLGDPYLMDDGWDLLWDTSVYSDGYYYVRVTVENEMGFTGQDTIVVKVDNEVIPDDDTFDPIIEDITYAQLHEPEEELHQYMLTAFVTYDEENEPLTYEWSTDCGDFVGDTNTYKVEWQYTPPGLCVDAIIILTVTDSEEGTDTFSKVLFSV